MLCRLERFFLGSDGYVRPCMSTPIKFFSIDKYCSFSEIWNSEKFINFRENVNDSKKCINHVKCVINPPMLIGIINHHLFR